MGSLILALQFPDTRLHTVQDDKIFITFSKTPVLGNENFYFTDSEVQANNSTIRNFVQLLNVKEKNFVVNDSLRYYRYNFKIKSLNNEKLESSAVQKILIDAKLIEPSKDVSEKNNF
ncbi:hypothetical protein [Chryseobacterium sp.]|uniref:hypothetical protein n=1 Tax=Chryseobacterium sp. TaxID=1871047 RepID=UPI001E2F8B72|nr:hypothetical protein [Chryseobacterium sp.]